MSFLERILLLIYYPQFHSPNESRFESFFVSILKNEKTINKINNSKIIFPEKIARNEDKRTSIIIKGIPCDMPKSEVRSLVDHYGNINYLYIIKSPFTEDKNISFAFINFINYKSIIPLYMDIRNLNIERNGKMHNFQIMYSNAQGKEKLKEYLKKNRFFKY